MIFWDKERHLTPRPAILESDIQAIISEVGKSSIKVAYPDTLANLVRLCFECALRARELTSLSVGHVFMYRRGAVMDSLRVGGREVQLSSIATEIITDQIRHLRRRKHSLRAEAPLYPDKSGKRYDHRLLRYHLLKASPESRRRVVLGGIRQSGMCQYYDRLKAAGANPDDCLLQTANFAGIKVYERKNLYPIIKRLLNRSN